MKLSDSEWTVMHALWQASPASAREVLERIPPETEWAYTTVKTMLSRLVDKGALSMEKRGNTSFFAPLLSQGQARRTAVNSLLERAFDGAFGSLLQHWLAEEKLSKKDRERLAAMLADEGARRPRSSS